LLPEGANECEAQMQCVVEEMAIVAVVNDMHWPGVCCDGPLIGVVGSLIDRHTSVEAPPAQQSRILLRVGRCKWPTRLWHDVFP